MRLTCLLAPVLAFSVLSAALPAAAEEQAGDQAAEQADQQAYAVLDIWLRVEQFNQRCHVLKYFEQRVVDQSISTAMDATPEGKAAEAAMSWPGFEPYQVAEADMVGAHRDAAKAAVAGQDCSAPQQDVQDARSYYLRGLLKLEIAAQDSDAKKADRPARRDASVALVDYIAALYGSENYAAVSQALVEELGKEGYDREQAWQSLDATLNDMLWDMRLSEKAYGFYPDPGKQGNYRAVKTDGSGTVFPASFKYRRQGVVTGADGEDIPANVAWGLTDKGEVALMIATDTADAAPADLKAQLLIQNKPESTWYADDWRADTVRVYFDRLDDADCPADVCFVLADKNARSLLYRQAGKDAYRYSYELVVAAADQFPLNSHVPAENRTKYYPPTLPGAD